MYLYKKKVRMTKESNQKLDSIESAINDIRSGKVIIVVDDENRENEGDFLAAAETITPEIINFMATHGRGLICAPITEKRSKQLKLNPMVGNNTDPMETAFTVSIDLIGGGVTTGISASDRSKTIKSLIDKKTRPHDISKPGHVFPLIAKEGGVLRRTGHTEAAIDFARLAGFEAAGVIVEIMNEDGSMARLPQLFEVAKKFNLKIISIEDLVAYRMEHDSLIEKKEDFQIETRFGSFRLRAYQQTTNDRLHIALTKGTWDPNEHVLTRINSKLINNDILGTLTNNIDKKLDDMFELVNNADECSRLSVFKFIKEQINEGRQIYIVYPLIEESKNMDFKDLMDGYESLSREFKQPKYQISIVHGRMKAQDKEFEMKRFENKETQILIATTVIEVGVNIPNASVMIIESSERFGLSQLHQLRGRVGRGIHKSYCILMSGNKLSNESKLRLKTMTQTNNGFLIAEKDLEIRGPGDIMGTQQSGVIDLKIADLILDRKILTYARKFAKKILEDDKNLTKDKNNNLLNTYNHLVKNKDLWSYIG